MLRHTRLLVQSLLVALVLMYLWPAAPVLSYIDLAPTLSKIIAESDRIALAEVVQYSREKSVVVLKEVHTMKGASSPDLIRHRVGTAGGATIPRPIMQWATPGARCVLFSSPKTTLVCQGQGWYQVHALGAGAWTLGADRPDLPLAYYGTVSRLASSITSMLDGKNASITVVAFGADNEGASFDLALNRQALPALVRVQRIRASLRMPSNVMAASGNPAYRLGSGPVDEADLPALMEKLRNADAMERAEAANDLRCLGGKAGAAAAPLAELLGDSAPCVRFSAAAALLRITPPHMRAVEILAQGLGSAELAVRRESARAAGLSGPAASPLADKLAALLKDPDESVRITALQAISLLGPAAGSAAGAVSPLLDEPALAIDAADALGRIGAAARPALKRLAQMLSSERADVRWAAVRAMSQIGGEDAHPAVEFMIRTLPGATEVEGYNIMIYLALLGPVAADAIPAIRSVRIKNPVLPSATQWAIAPDKSFPWLGGGRPGMPGPGGPGPGGPGPGGPGPRGGPGDIALYVYEAYIHELGDRLRPAAGVLARKIMDGTAGDVPTWGYKILACGPVEALDILSPHLADSDLSMRERATVALGYMGKAAAPAKEQIKTALSKAPTEREQRLLRWCLREVDPQ